MILLLMVEMNGTKKVFVVLIIWKKKDSTLYQWESQEVKLVLVMVLL